MLVDDHEIVLEGLRDVLVGAGDFEVVGQASDGQMAVEMASDLHPDVVVMDLIMPVKNGIDSCREIMDELPNTRVLVLTMSTEQDAVVDSLAAGATGYLQKVCGRQEFLSAVRGVAAGEYRIPNDALRRVLAGVRSAPRPSGGSTLDSITVREREMLALFARGRSYAQIGEARGIRPVTVRNAIYSIQRKLGFANKQELVFWAVQNGLVDGGSEAP
ncbi:Transcriptional regulatory protein LiaR [Geodia barretti]|uniref:Transcriptional regulatory protein LiaR n=1 Tax=Geodia barretti TaxID=519541 RepID=A0AA35X8B0_GEOBA|nr:Transcriptional regulatory protein LiaR [Geodia barretti]